MVDVFFKFWRISSVVFVMAILLFCYTTLPEDVAVKHNEFGRPTGYIDKSDLFYIVGGLIIGFNLLMGLMKNATLKVDFEKLNPSSIWARAKDALSKLLLHWFDAFMATINTLLVFILLGLNSVNRQIDQALDRDYSLVLLAMGLVVLFLIFFVPLKILFTNPRESR